MKKFLILIAVALAIAWRLTTPKPAPPAAPIAPSPNRQPAIDKSDELQKHRDAVIQKLLSDGSITKVEQRRGIVKVFVTDKFYASDFESKRIAASIIYARYCDPADSFYAVDLVDHRSGKSVGRFSSLGLKMD